MATTTYQTITTQAWSTYTSVSGRDSTYTKLLDEPYKAFLKNVTTFDALAAKLNVDKPASSDIESAQNLVEVMEASFNGIDPVLTRFKTMDTEAVGKAAILDQGKVRAKLAQEEGYDATLQLALNNVLYQCQLLTMGAMTAS